MSEDDPQPGRVKRKRQTQACDGCRARKVKCDRPSSEGTIGQKSNPSQPCTPCKGLGVKCTFSYIPKKRGPANKLLRQLAEDTLRYTSPTENDAENSLSTTNAVAGPSRKNTRYPPNPTRQEVSTPYVTSTSYYRSSSDIEGLSHGTLAEQYAMHASSLERQGIAEARFKAIDVERDWEPHLIMTLNATAPGGVAYEPYRPEHPEQSVGEREKVTGNGAPAQDPDSADRSLGRDKESQIQMSEPPPEVDEALSNAVKESPLGIIMPRWRLLRTLELFFDFVHPLSPSVEQDELLRDLESGREQQPDANEWIAMVLAILSHTLAQLPASFFSLSKEDTAKLGHRCLQTSRAHLDKYCKGATLERLLALYHISLAGHLLEDFVLAHTSMGTAHALALQMGLFKRQSASAGVSDDQNERRKRLVAMLWTLDKTTALTRHSLPIIGSYLRPASRSHELTEKGSYPAVFLVSRLSSHIGQVLEWGLEDDLSDNALSGSPLAQRLRNVDVIKSDLMEVEAQWSSLSLYDPPLSSNIDVDSHEPTDNDPKSSAETYRNPDEIPGSIRYRELIQWAQSKLMLCAAFWTLHAYCEKLQVKISLPKRQDPLSWSTRGFASCAALVMKIFNKLPMGIIRMNQVLLQGPIQSIGSAILESLNESGLSDVELLDPQVRVSLQRHTETLSE